MVLAASNICRADDPSGTRYGLFNLLDNRSKYNTGWFPEPLHTDEMDGDQELRLNYFHQEKTDHRETEASAEIEKSFGQLSIEVEFPYASETETEDGETNSADGIGNIELSARHPFFQYVSPGGFFDYTAGGRVELAIATGSDVSKNTELVAGLYQTIGLGDHFSIQMGAGYSTLFGPGEDQQERNLESTAVFGYNIDVKNFLDLVRVTPVFELDGETALNKGLSGSTELNGDIGAVLAFDSIKWGQPKMIVGYVFPLSNEAKADFDWGVTVSLILEY